MSTYTSAMEEGMFSSTHFRSSSWKFNHATVSWHCVWKLREREDVRLSLTTLLALAEPLVSFFTPLIFIPSGDTRTRKHRKKRNKLISRWINKQGSTEDGREERGSSSFWPKASFIMGSFSSSSLSSSSRGLKAYLRETQSFTLLLQKLESRTNPTAPPYLWLLADGRHRNMMTNRMVENKKRQNASSIHSSLQSCRGTWKVFIHSKKKHWVNCGFINIQRKGQKMTLEVSFTQVNIDTVTSRFAGDF